MLEGEVAVGLAETRFAESGELVDEGVREQLAEVVSTLVGEPARVPVAA